MTIDRPAPPRAGAPNASPTERTMVIAILNNLPELIMGGAWSGLVFYFGYRLGRGRRQRAV